MCCILRPRSSFFPLSSRFYSYFKVKQIIEHIHSWGLFQMSQAERGRGRVREVVGRDRKTYWPLVSWDLARRGKKNRAPIASGASVKLHHQRRTIAGRAGTCGRQLIVCQKQKKGCRAHRFNFVKLMCTTQRQRQEKKKACQRSAQLMFEPPGRRYEDDKSKPLPPIKGCSLDSRMFSPPPPPPPINSTLIGHRRNRDGQKWMDRRASYWTWEIAEFFSHLLVVGCVEGSGRELWVVTYISGVRPEISANSKCENCATSHKCCQD